MNIFILKYTLIKKYSQNRKNLPVHFLELSPSLDTLFFRVLFSPDTLIVFLRFHKSFNYGTVVGFLYYQISHYGSFNVRGGVSRADHRGGGEGLVLEENNTTQKVPNSGAKHPNHASVYVRRCIFDVILLNFITFIISLIACPSKISHTGRKW